MINKGDVLFYARALPKVGIFEVEELKVRTVADDYFVGTEKHSKQAFPFGYEAIGKRVFTDRDEALFLVNKEEEKYNAERNKDI